MISPHLRLFSQGKWFFPVISKVWNLVAKAEAKTVLELFKSRYWVLKTDYGSDTQSKLKNKTTSELKQKECSF